MGAPFGKNALTFSDVVKFVRTTFEAFCDRRTGKNTNYTMTGAGLGAFSVFFMQSPPFLDFQRAMQGTQGKNNAQTLSGVFQIPTDNHIRTLPDAVEPAAVCPLFDWFSTGGGNRPVPHGRQPIIAGIGWNRIVFIKQPPRPVLFV